MRHPFALTNPHLRARLAEILEALIPFRDDEEWNSRPVGSNLFTASGLRLYVPHIYERRVLGAFYHVS